MDWSALALAAFAVGTAGNSLKSVPQFARTAVRGRVAGLSATAVWLAFAANVLWLCFGLAIQDWLFVALGVVQTVLVTGTVGRYVVVTGWSRNARQALLALAACSGFGVLAATGTALALETLGAGLGVVVGAPQLMYLWRRRRVPTDVSGVSQWEYVIVIAAQVAWTVYWLAQGHPVAAAGAACGGFARATTLTLLRRQAAQAHLVAPQVAVASASRS